jgi:hypothetical protein
MWQESHEHMLREWKAKSFINLWLQEMSSYYYARVHDILTFPVIVFSSLSSAALFSRSESELIKYMVSGLTILTGILTVVTRQMRPGELYQEYSIIAKRYKALIRTIDTCLDLPVEMRAPPEAFTEKIKTEMNTLSSAQLSPPLFILRMFEKKFGSLEQKMFGEDIVEILQQDIQTRKNLKRVLKKKRDSVIQFHQFHQEVKK